MEAFKNLHKECEQIKTSGLSTAEIRRVKKSDKIIQPWFRFFVKNFVSVLFLLCLWTRCSVEVVRVRAGGHCRCLFETALCRQMD